MYLAEYLSKFCEEKDIRFIIKNLSQAAIKISKIIRSVDNAVNVDEKYETKNIDGDIQKPLDILSDEILLEFLKKSPASAYASEEQEGFVDFKNNNEYIVFADPLDGSSNIDVNVSIGTIFSVMPRNDLSLEKAFLQKGMNQKASGFFVYGPQTTLFLTVGKGTALFCLDEERNEFIIVNEQIKIPISTNEFAINASYSRFWDIKTSNYIENCQQGIDGPRDKNFGMRWVGSLVADASRIFNRGGIFLYPADSRVKYKEGRLRLTYEANPIAMLIREANGKATNGLEDILNIEVKSIHQRSSLIFGSSEEVEEYIKSSKKV